MYESRANVSLHQGFAKADGYAVVQLSPEEAQSNSGRHSGGEERLDGKGVLLLCGVVLSADLSNARSRAPSLNYLTHLHCKRHVKFVGPTPPSVKFVINHLESLTVSLKRSRLKLVPKLYRQTNNFLPLKWAFSNPKNHSEPNFHSIVNIRPMS